MFRNRKRRLLVVLMVVVTLLASGMTTLAASSEVKLSGFNVPSSVVVGHGITVKGTVSSNVTIRRIEVGVVNASTNSWTQSRYDNPNVNAKSFDLSKAASKMAVSRMGKGTYKYRIYAHTSDGKVHIVLNKQFTITAAPPKKAATPAAPASNTSKPAAQTTASKVTVSGFNVPSSVVVGHGITVKGTVSSNVTIKRIEVGVVDASYNSWTSSRYDNQSVNAKSFDLTRAAGKMAVSKLGVGTYKYRIYAHTSDGKVHIVLNKEFSVNAKTSGTTAKTTTLAPTNTTASTAKNTVTIKGLTRPGTYRVGTSLHTKGIITSKEKIKRIEAGIIFAPTNKWTPYYYDNKLVNSNTFDLTRVDSKLSFSKLPAGEYRYRIYVHTASGMTVALNHKFNVIGSNKPQLAVNWAIRIANDNSFTYGRKPEANAVGCYFCGTNCGPVKYRKPKGYEKTYVCLTFIGAAYAHGAKDPEILSECKRGRMTMYETDDNFRLFSCWMKLGSCKDLKISDLMPGDVIIQWSDWNDNNGHVCMYIGNDKLVESSGGGWDANSIAVKSGAGRRLRSLGYGKNYVMRYTK